MSDSSFRISRGVTLNPQVTAPANPTPGDIFYDSTLNTFVFWDGAVGGVGGSWINLASQVDVASATSLTSATLTAAIVQNSLIRITGAVAATIHGLAASTSGKQVTVIIKAQIQLLF